jgi:hypothetical protein
MSHPELTRQYIWRFLNDRLTRHEAILGVVLAVAMALPATAWLVQQIHPTAFGAWPAAAADRHFEYAVAYESGPPAYESHIPTPEVVKGIYLTANTVAWERRLEQLIDLVDRTELNTMVIDVKDHSSRLAFPTDDSELAPYVSSTPLLGDLKALTERLHEHDIYLVARVFVFQDQQFAVKNPQHATKYADGRLWRDYRGLLWLDPAARPVWDYNIAVALAAIEGGFDEVQFDYIRFPSDGNTRAIEYPHWDGVKPKSEVMGEMFAYLSEQLRAKRHIKTSVDLFGLTMWELDYDLNIGQRLDQAAPYFDYISPMVYPSHYPVGYQGLANPAAHPYQIIYSNMERGEGLLNELRAVHGADQIATVRTWIQDFDMGAEYGSDKVRAQMRATMDGGGTGWLLWNAANRYTEAALEANPKLK